jgi:hypothetical protein
MAAMYDYYTKQFVDNITKGEERTDSLALWS